MCDSRGSILLSYQVRVNANATMESAIVHEPPTPHGSGFPLSRNMTCKGDPLCTRSPNAVLFERTRHQSPWRGNLTGVSIQQTKSGGNGTGSGAPPAGRGGCITGI